jgi:preprotein translocase subunit SecA
MCKGDQQRVPDPAHARPCRGRARLLDQKPAAATHEYQREGYDMFTAIMDGIKEESVTALFNFQLQVAPDPIVAENRAAGPVGGLVPVRRVPQPASPPEPRQRPQHAQRRGQQGQRQQPGAVQQPAANGEPGLPAGLAKGLARPRRAGNLSYSAPADDASGRAKHSGVQAGGGNFAGAGRNAPCPCGSGKKYKQCHPSNRQHAGTAADHDGLASD